METVNIKTHKRGDELGSNYALRDSKLNLKATHTPVYEAPGSDRFDDDGGYIPRPIELTDAEKYRSSVRIRPAKKQRAAKCLVPKESIKVVSMSKPVPRPVAIAIFEDKTEQEVEIARLEARVRELMFQVSRPNPVPTPGKPVADLDGLIEAFQRRHTKV
jgi:hypothetical protein